MTKYNKEEMGVIIKQERKVYAFDNNSMSHGTNKQIRQ
jgi:hypothetical protein